MDKSRENSGSGPGDPVRIVNVARTADGCRMTLWDSGLVTTQYGAFMDHASLLDGPSGSDAALWAGWRVFEELPLMVASDVPAALREAAELAMGRVQRGLQACDWWMAITLTGSSVE